MDTLPDPKNDRKVPTVPKPPKGPIKRDILFKKDNVTQFETPDWKALKDHFKLEGKVAQKEVVDIINGCTEITRKEPNLLKLEEPIVVVGDLHG